MNRRVDDPSTGGAIELSLDFGLINISGGTETFTIVIGVPLFQSLASTSVAGTVEGKLVDANFNDGATMTSHGALPMHQGLIDGSSSLDLWRLHPVELFRSV